MTRAGRNLEPSPPNPLSAPPDAMSLVVSAYARLAERAAAARRRLGRPLTLAEKVLYGHLAGPFDGLDA